jgi:hypothetical protein
MDDADRQSVGTGHGRRLVLPGGSSDHDRVAEGKDQATHLA